MQIEQLNENKIRITLNMEDLEAQNIDLHSFMSKPIETQALVLDMLQVAEEKLGFITKDYKVSIEAIAMPNHLFILTITRAEVEKKKRKVIPKRKAQIINQNSAIYCFQTFDEFLEFCKFASQNQIRAISTYTNQISLHTLNEKYYLNFHGFFAAVPLLKGFCTTITEFATYTTESELFEHKLLEYGNIVIKENAIETAINYFVKEKKK